MKRSWVKMNKYLEIIKKQQEIIDLLMEGKIAESDLKIQDNLGKTVAEFNVESFEKWLSEKGLSKNCVDTYSRQVRLFFERHKILNVETLTEYEASFSEIAPKTANIRIAAMNKFFEFMKYTGYKFKRRKEQKRTFCDNTINETQYNQLLEWAAENSPKVWLIAKVLANTGVRVSELIELKTSSLNEGHADIVGKGGKLRRIYYPQSLVNDIAEKCGKIFIIENHRGKQITTRGVAGILRESAEKSGVPKEVLHPHSFRHYFAKRFLKQKNDITLLGDLLGHSNLSTTAIYTRQTSEEQRDEINNVVNW